MNGTGIKRKHLGEQAWRDIMSRMEASGLSGTVFCRREGLAVSSLKRWRERLTKPALTQTDAHTPAMPPASLSPAAPPPKPAPPTTPKFIELGALGQASGGTGRLEIKLDLGGGLSLYLVRG